MNLARQRIFIAVVLIVCFTFISFSYLKRQYIVDGLLASNGSGSDTSPRRKIANHLPSNAQHVSLSTLDWYRRAWTDEHQNFALPTISALCSRTEWHADVFLQCDGLGAGLTTIMSSLRVCLKMAMEAGIHIVLPAIAIRDAENLRDFNTFNDEHILPYGDWFDEEFLFSTMAYVCPQMKIARRGPDKQPLLVDSPTAGLDFDLFDGFKQFEGIASVLRPWRDFAWGDDGIPRSIAGYHAGMAQLGLPAQTGPIRITMYTPFLFFRITDDVTGIDRKLWHELNHMIRFKSEVRSIVQGLWTFLEGRKYIGIHYRGEHDNIWSPPAVQMERDLEVAEQVWQRYLLAAGTDNPDLTTERTIYLACGSDEAVKDFTQTASARNWTVIDKLLIARDLDSKVHDDDLHGRDSEVLEIGTLVEQIRKLPFDHQGSIDLAVMALSDFFIGISGSAFSTTLANLRDPLGRYRGSTLNREWDSEAMTAATHLFRDGDGGHYPCCF